MSMGAITGGDGLAAARPGDLIAFGDPVDHIGISNTDLSFAFDLSAQRSILLSALGGLS